VEVLGVGALGVKGVGGDDHLAQVGAEVGELVEQRGELGDLVGLRADLDLGQDQRVGVGGRGQQVRLSAVGVEGAAHGLAVTATAINPAPADSSASGARCRAARAVARASSQAPIAASTAAAPAPVRTRHRVVLDGDWAGRA
jgi:hypothetical protein